jgi:prepilin-type processing-associated H-X9-DG protein
VGAAAGDFDPLTERHGGRANVVFADGHAEAVLPAFGTNAAHSLPHY